MVEKTYVEALLPYLKGKKIEVYTSTFSKERLYSDFNDYVKEVIRGTLRDASGDLLIIDVDIDGDVNTVYINSYSITAVIEPKNGISLRDVYYDEHETKRK